MTVSQERKLVTQIPGPRSVELLGRVRQAVARGIGIALPVFVTEAGGGILVDADGNQLIDLGAGIAVTNVGNAAPAVVAAVQEQVARFTHTCFMVNPYEGYLEVCETLNRITPGDHEKRSVLLNSGAEAVENAVKIARSHTRRNAVVVFDHGYHGRTNLTMAMTAKNMPYKDGFGPFTPEVYRVPTSYPYRDGLSGSDAAARSVAAIEKYVGASNVACVVLEPIHGEGGFVVPAAGFLPAIASWCRDNGVVFVADEIQTGFGRTGDLFACFHEGVVPDLITLAKGIAGGLPLGAVTGRAEIMDAPHVSGLGGTYGGNPVACAAALAAIETIETEDLPARARGIGDIMLPALSELAARHPVIGDVRGRGAMIAIELVDASGEPDPAATSAIAKACHAEGMMVLTAGTHGNVIRFLPPLVMPPDLLREAMALLARVFDARQGSLGGRVSRASHQRGPTPSRANHVMEVWGSSTEL